MEKSVKGVGYKGGGSSYIYNITADAWSLTTAVPFSSWYQTEGAVNYLEINVNGKVLITDVQNGAAVATTGIDAPIRDYVIGSTVNEVYDPATDSWTKAAIMPTSRTDFGLAIANDVIYAIGGFISSAPSAINEQYKPIGYGTPDPAYVLQHMPPKISVLSPLNQTYDKSGVPLAFTIDKAVNWTGYSLDGGKNVTIAGNCSIAGVPNGVHSITVYANDTYGNMGASPTVTFTVAKPEPFPTALVATPSGASAAVACLGLLVYFKKRKNARAHSFP
jgi:hypothetical protein